MRRALPILVLTVALGAGIGMVAAQEPRTVELSLEQCLRMALKNNLVLYFRMMGVEED